MSLTKNQYPDAYTPNWNEQTFEYTSTQTGQSDFKYVIVVTDVITSASQTYNIKQAPNTAELKWYANVFTNQYIRHYISNNTYGWQKCTDAIRRIIVEVKEYYGGVTYAASPPSTTTYIIWNGVLRTLDWVDYDYNDFVYNATNGNIKYLTELSNKTTYDDTSLFLYALTSAVNDIILIRIKSYDSTGTLIGTSYIENQYTTSTTYTNKYLSIDIGKKGLDTISAGAVVGTYPILGATTSYYTIEDISNSDPNVGWNVSTLGNIAALLVDIDTIVTSLFTVTIECSPTYDVWTLHYLANNGNFETLHFPKKSLKTEVIDKKTYRQNPNTLTTNNWAYTKFSEWEKVQSSTGQETISINTDWLSEDQIAQHIQIVSAARVYIDFGSTIGLVPCKVLTSSIPQNKDISTALFGISLEIQPTYKNNYQHG